jgi:hypothetical protein
MIVETQICFLLFHYVTISATVNYFRGRDETYEKWNAIAYTPARYSMTKVFGKSSFLLKDWSEYYKNCYPLETLKIEWECWVDNIETEARIQYAFVLAVPIKSLFSGFRDRHHESWNYGWKCCNFLSTQLSYNLTIR